MLNRKSNNTKLIVETWRRFMNEGSVETELETKQMVYPGDWIIRQMTNAKEQYKNEEKKFVKIYNQTPLGDGPDGFKIYQPKPDNRDAIVVDEKFVALFNTSGGVVSQQEFFNECSKLPTVKVSKTKKVYAKQHQGEPFELSTEVQKTEGREEFKIEAPWGATMPIKLGDIIIVMSDEAYRIARAEFDQTYEFV